MKRYDLQALEQSADMAPIAGTVEVAIPADVLWHCFRQPRLWPRWNRCMFWVHTRELRPGSRLIWAFQPIRRRYLYKLPGVATIVELEEGHKVTWEVTALPGFYARHSYFVEEAGPGRSRFGSTEKAMGPAFRRLKRFWLAHFTFVKDRSLEGAQSLERLYQERGRLEWPETRPLQVTP
jgi:hypothetical protein